MIRFTVHPGDVPEAVDAIFEATEELGPMASFQVGPFSEEFFREVAITGADEVEAAHVLANLWAARGVRWREEP